MVNNSDETVPAVVQSEADEASQEVDKIKASLGASPIRIFADVRFIELNKLKDEQKNGEVAQNGTVDSSDSADGNECLLNGKANGSGTHEEGTEGSTENAEAEADGMDEDGKAEGGSKQEEEMEVEQTEGAADQSNGREDGEKAEQPSDGDERPPELEQLQEAAGTGDQEMEKEVNGVDSSNEDAPDLTKVSPVKENGETSKRQEPGQGKKKAEEPECIELDDDDEEDTKPPAKKQKLDGSQDDVQILTPGKKDGKNGEMKEEKKEKVPELTSPEALLNKLEEYIKDAIDNKKGVERKVLDALLGAINVQVQREPLSVRRLILDKQLVLPNTISFPPSQVVDLLIEHDPDHPLAKVINRMFGDEKPKLSEAEKKEKAQLKLTNSAPNLTKMLLDIGQDLVQEATYCDIVHARNLPETPKNIETYKQVAAQLKPVWESLRKRNEPYKLKLVSCNACGFKTESELVLAQHCSVVHSKNGKYVCALCNEYDTSEQRLINHYLECHFTIATKEEQPSKYPCMICEQDFQYKGLRDQHMRICKKDYVRARQIMAPRSPDDHLMVQTWLWPRPTVDPTILSQQQAAQQQAKRQQLTHSQPQGSQHAANNRRSIIPNAVNAAAQAALIQQQMLQQQKLRQLQSQAAMLQASSSGNSLLSNNTFIQAMQQHLQRQNAAQQSARSNASPQTNNILTQQSIAAATALYQKSLAAAAASKNPAMSAAAQQAMKRSLSGVSGLNVAAMQKALSSFGGSLLSAASTSSGTSASSSSGSAITCEICDQAILDREKYFNHLQVFHKQMRGKSFSDMQQGGAPLACSRCRERFWTYEGLERHLVMAHGLVTADLLTKAQKKEDGGRCKLCGKQYAFNILQHLVADHQIKLCSAEIMYSCDVCYYKCNTYSALETHLSTNHPKNGAGNTNGAQADKDKRNAGQDNNDKDPKKDCITLDDD
ncbi:hypothetical protein WR25_01918 [Diploscapter pachys]|uniref:C2H2-type domain-containing protein n=1 Tax=Diploscapter pachys TaxID=2018661 RepID=A0A2A2JSC4_9BILA|nr:hypothetical protein WR25_01918 [Diploscapter pachys]